jgi:uncharacterized cupredoxin-like copper-binding protein
MTSVPFRLVLCFAVAASVVAPSALARSGSKTLLSKVTVTAGQPSEFKFVVAPSTAKRGLITFNITNKGKLPHDFTLCSKASTSLANSCSGRSSGSISPGQSKTLRVTVLRKGTYEYLCSVPGHAAAGMKGFLKVS